MNNYFTDQNEYRSSQEDIQLAADAALSAIQRKSSAVDLYSRLAVEAPNTEHRDQLLFMLENNKAQWRQLSELYINLTGMQPNFQYEHVHFENYRDGLAKAFNTETAGWSDNRSSGHPVVQPFFVQVHHCERDSAGRLSSMNADLNLRDFGSNPYVVNIDQATVQNTNYRTALWTGDNLQVTLMSIDVGDSIGLEVHPDTDQFLRIEQGQGLVQMGDTEDNLDYEKMAYDDFAIMVPAGKWHNLTNTGNIPLKVYAIYAPPEHPFGTVHVTKEEAMEAE